MFLSCGAAPLHFGSCAGGGACAGWLSCAGWLAERHWILEQLEISCVGYLAKCALAWALNHPDEPLSDPALFYYLL